MNSKQLTPPINNQRLLAPVGSLFGISFKLALKSIEQITILFFIPTLLLILGQLYAGKALTSFGQVIHLHQAIGLGLIAVALIGALINYGPSLYFRSRTSLQGKPVSIIECYRIGIKTMIKLILASLLSLLVIIIGFVLLIVPGVLLLRRFIFVPYYVLDNPKLSLMKVFKLAASGTKNYEVSIYSLYGLILPVSFILKLFQEINIICSIAAVILSYTMLFMPALRYAEIIKDSKVSSVDGKQKTD